MPLNDKDDFCANAWQRYYQQKSRANWQAGCFVGIIIGIVIGAAFTWLNINYG